MENGTYVVALILSSVVLAVAGCPPTNGDGDADADTETEDTVSEDTNEMDTDGGGPEDGGDTSELGDTEGDTMGDSSDEDAESDGGQDTQPPRFEQISCSSATNVTDVTVGPGFSYTPTDATVQVGETIRWTWASNVTLPHNVVADDDADCANAKPSWFESSTTDDTGNTYCVRFNEAGTWNYQCTVGDHCSDGMKGSVIVQSN